MTEPHQSNVLVGRRALVVGGGSGIGLAVVRRFLDEGAKVGVLELDGAKCASLRSAHAEAVVEQGDACERADLQRGVEATVDAFGGLDVLVQCVGRFDFGRRLATLTSNELDAGFDAIMRVNVKSHLLAVHVAYPHLLSSRGSVILTGSTSSFYPGRGGLLYVASKFALRGIVLSLAREFAPDVRVNGVAPGGTVGTDLRGLEALGAAEHRLDDAPDRQADVKSRNPLHLALSPDDHAASYVFLASDAAKGMTGTFLQPDGGVGVMI